MFYLVLFWLSPSMLTLLFTMGLLIINKLAYLGLPSFSAQPSGGQGGRRRGSWTAHFCWSPHMLYLLQHEDHLPHDPLLDHNLLPACAVLPWFPRLRSLPPWVPARTESMMMTTSLQLSRELFILSPCLVNPKFVKQEIHWLHESWPKSPQIYSDIVTKLIKWEFWKWTVFNIPSPKCKVLVSLDQY